MIDIDTLVEIWKAEAIARRTEDSEERRLPQSVRIAERRRLWKLTANTGSVFFPISFQGCSELEPE
jgi:hypothetical protein